MWEIVLALSTPSCSKMRRSARSARRRRPRGKQKRARVKKEKSLMKMRYELRRKAN